MKELIRRRKIPLILSAVLTLAIVLTTLFPINVVFPTGDIVSDENASFTVGTGDNSRVRIYIGSPVMGADTADYTCDGDADDVTFQTALSALPATGGELFVLAGTYVWQTGDHTVTRAIDNVSIVGIGGSVYFDTDDTNEAFAAGGDNWLFANLQVDNGGIDMGSTTDWMWLNVEVAGTYYSLYTDSINIEDHSGLHESGGTDAIKLDDLATPDDNTDLNASTSAHGLLRKLDNDTAHFLRGDGTWATPAGAGDVSGPASSTDHAVVRFDGTSGKTIQDYTSNAPTMSDVGVLTMNANIIMSGSTTVDGIDISAHDTAVSGVHGAGANTILHSGNLGSTVQDWDDDLDDLSALTPTDSYFIVGDNTNWVAEAPATARTSIGLGLVENTAHSTDAHTMTIDGRDVSSDGAKLDLIEALADVTDETNVIAALSGATVTNAVVVTDDKILFLDTSDSDNLRQDDAQTIANLATAIKLDDFAAPDNNTDLDASATAHGLLPKLDNTGTKYLRDDGTWQTVSAGTHALGAGQTDVVITDVADNDILAYDSGGNWINQSAAEAGLLADAIDIINNTHIDWGATGNQVDADDVPESATRKWAGETNADVTDETNVKAALDGATITNAVITGSDKVLFQDATDSDNLRQDDAQTLANLATPEGTAILSTGETGGVKFLREDGDNSCSWQSIPGGGDMLKSTYDVLEDGDIDTAAGGTNMDSSGSTGVPRVSSGTWTIDATFNHLGAATAEVDIGSYNLKGLTLESDATTGTAPLTIASTTAVNNLNADMLDDYEASAFILHSLADTANDFLVASGDNSFVKKTLAETGAILEGDIDHDLLQGFVSGEHFTMASIDTVGTITTGAWQSSTPVGIAYGGTGQTTAANALAAFSGVATSEFDWNAQDLDSIGVLFINERAAKVAYQSGKGEIWVKNDAPSTLWYTDDADNDYQLGVGGADEKVKVDSGATADYIGAASNDGVLRTSAPFQYTDGGDYITLALDASGADKILYSNGIDTWAETSITSDARGLLDDANYAAMRTTLTVYSTTETDSAIDTDIATHAGDADAHGEPAITADSGSVTADDLAFSIIGGTGITTSGATTILTIVCDLEGTELKSTGESGGNKFLREDGDGTCSWQTIAGGGDMLKSTYDIDEDGDIDTTAGGTEWDSSGATGLAYINSGAWGVKTIGILDTNILQADATAGAPNDDEWARFTALGLEGYTTAEMNAILETDLDHGSIQGLGDNDHSQYVLHSLSTAADDFLVGSGSNTYIKKTLAETGAILETDISHDNLVDFESNEHFTQASITTVGTVTSGAWQSSTPVGLAYGGTGQTTAAGALNALSGVATSAFDWQTQDLTDIGVMFLNEQADAETDVDGDGQIWVNTATPNELYFTGDTGLDKRLDGYFTITFVIDGGGSAVTTGEKGYLEIPFACTLTEWRILTDTSSTTTVDVWSDTYTNFPADNADAMPGAGNEPKCTTARKGTGTITGTWTKTTIVEEDCLVFYVDANDNATRITVSLKGYKT